MPVTRNPTGPDLSAMATVDVAPRTSSTGGSGFVVNPAIAGNNAWREAALDILAYEWANTDPAQRENFMQPYWGVGAVNGASKYGNLDMTDRVGANGIVYTSPATMAGLSRYLSTYVPGSNPTLESVIPYVPPAPNEYIESPDSVAARVSQFNNDRNYALNVAQENRIAAGQRASIAASNASSAAARSAASEASKNALAAAKMQADASRYGTDKQYAASIFGTNAGLWGSKEGNILDAIGGAGNLSLGYQGLLDQRVRDIIQNKSNPADFVERVHSIRALDAPVGTDVIGYRDVPELQGSIDKLYNYKPSAQPVPGAAAGASGVRDTVIRVGEKSAPMQKDTTEYVFNPTNAPLEVIPANAHGQALQMAMSRGFAGGSPAAPAFVDSPVVKTDIPKSPPVQPGPIDYDKNGPPPPLPTLPGNAYRGFTPYSWGELAANGVAPASAANPYANQQLYANEAGTKVVRVDPATGMTYSVYNDPATNPAMTSYNPNIRGSFSRTGSRDARTVVEGSTPRPDGQRRREYDQRPLGSGTTTTPTGEEIPENVTTPATNTQTTPAATTPVATTPAATLPASELNTIFKDYTDEQIQNLPFLKYLQGTMSPEAYNSLSTAFLQGPFGTLLPEAGALNLNQIHQISQDPDALGMLSSLYKGGNRNLASLIALAAQRAPVGNAIATSGIQT